MVIVGLYVLFLIVTGVFVNWHTSKNRQSSTTMRKIFHILIVAVYLPGLVYQCYLLFVASVIILAILIVLETARVIKLIPVADVLESSVQAFIDEKDTGVIALTPLYLLIGCSLPLWIHNSPCDLIDSSSNEILPLLAGIISIGIGDTFASIVGSKIGRHKWKSSTNRSVEGTIASILAQASFIYCLSYFGLIYLNLRLTAFCGIAVITNALVEAFTNQVDNLILPIITYIMLTFK
jgi:dolichol kinase